jgi:lysophospholipase L1-like esterase
VLAGDSTVTDASGWGAGFKAVLECTNIANGGRSSRSFRSEGWWEQCLQAQPEYLLIQFGHNDQPGKGPERESAADGDFRSHLRAYVAEARRAGIKPVLITSLERRRWNERGRIEPTLSDYAEATKAVAVELSVPLIDLNRLSIELYNRLGATAVRAMEPMSMEGADHTHLNAEGSQVIGELVARELVKLFPALADHALRELADPQPQRAAPDSALGGLSVRETEATLVIVHKHQPLLVYNKQSPPVPAGIDPIYARSGFLHPVCSPQGKEVTATFPLDHAHQHGIFGAWVKTTYAGREVDFWNLPGRTGRVEWVQGEKLTDAQGQPLNSEASDFINDSGSNRQAGNHQPARWVALRGNLAGQPVCIAVLSHASNFRAPQAARLHPTKPYFCYSPCVDAAFVIDQQHPLHMRYRYLVTDTEPDPGWIDQQWQQWCGGLAGVP